jgi:uncharacterized protein (DUF1778 family)
MTTATRTEKLDLRLSPQAKQRLYAAAEAEQRTVSEFVLQSALERAEETLADRRLFSLAPAQWKAFQAALDAPPRPLPRLRKLLRSVGQFDTSRKA